MLSADAITARQAEVAENGELAALLQRLGERALPIMERTPIIPTVKAMLSTDGGTCPSCRSPLAFDPWEPEQHRCSKCERIATGDRHHAHWARAQHLWLSERAVHLAVVAAFTGEERFARRSRELLAAYHQLYFELPNSDNVLGPSHLFFSTYLESIWLLNYLGAAVTLRERGWLSEAETEAVSAIADEAATIIADFNEGMSNRQTWNSAALTAIAAWFGDAELAATAIQGRTGLLGHLTDGFGDDGMWFEGENYHLFAMRGLLIGLDWARSIGVDLLDNPELAEHLGQALLAPSLTALPDDTFPARRDSRFGVSLAHPAYLECWEAGLASLGDAAPPELAAWLHALYRAPARPAATYDAYLHDAGEPPRDSTSRADLSWWMLLAMTPSLPPDTLPWRPPSVLLPNQGVAILRQHGRYVSMECGVGIGGHGHPDRLHLTVHADGVHWLADPGTGSYVNNDLFWFRSTLAHNAPRLDGRSQTPEEASATAFDDRGDWGWIQAAYGPVRRSVVHGPDFAVDVVELVDGPDRLLELPWHFDGTVSVTSPGEWSQAELPNEFVSDAQFFVSADGGPVRVEVVHGDRTLVAWLAGGELLRAVAPGRPGATELGTMLVLRARDAGSRLTTVLDFGGGVTGLETTLDGVTITAADRLTRIAIADGEATVEGTEGKATLRGLLPPPVKIKTLIAERDQQSYAHAMHLEERPMLDGTLDGFDLSAPIELSDELRYRRSELPYEGPEQFSATAFVNWDNESLYLAVDVVKPDVVVRAPDDPPLELDNDPDDVHSDGIQVYYTKPGGSSSGYLIRPGDGGALWARPIPGEPTILCDLEGASTRTDLGYRITVALPCPGLDSARERQSIQFELLVNEMRSGRVRRAGQLAWGGHAGWVYLRGDRADPAQFGTLELAG